MDLTTFGVGVATGLGLGSIYALIAVGFSLVVASTGYFMFALESIVALGGIFYRTLAGGHGWPLAVALPIVCIGGAVCGAVLEIVVHRPFVGRARNVGLPVLLAGVGVAIAVDALAAQVVGSDPKSAPSYISPDPIMFGSVPVNRAYVVMFATVIAIGIVLEIVFRATTIGRRLRILQADREGAALLGLNVKRTTTAVFAVSGLLAALAGLLVTPVTSASPSVGSSLVVPAFAAIALGGFGSFRGAIGGGLVVGLLSGLLPLYIKPAYLSPVLLGLIIATLVARPRGLFAVRAAREL
jgi:branched-chain amino acid transport system permease protein